MPADEYRHNYKHSPISDLARAVIQCVYYSASLVAVVQSLNRRNQVILTGPLEELFTASQPIVDEYLSKHWTLQNTQTNPNGGPSMMLTFTKEKEQGVSGAA